MSETIRFDAFLVQHLADELHRELADRRVDALQLDSLEQRVAIDVGGDRITWQLHAARAGITRTPVLYPLPDSAILPRKARVAAVRALADERVLVLELAGETRMNATFAVVIELITNQWNAIALDQDGRILRVLRRRDGERAIQRGQPYRPPARPAEARAAYRSPLNEQLSDERFERMLAEAPQPALIAGPAGLQPYPHPMWQEDARRFDSLLAAFQALRTGPLDALVSELERRQRAAERKADRLRAEMAKATSAGQASRAHADLLLAYAGTIARGVKRITLPAFGGGSVEIELDPALSAVDNAQRLYAEARKHERALARIPDLLADAEREHTRAHDLLAKARRGELAEAELAEITRRPALARPQAPVEKLPYRTYRTSSGLEVRVGRNARANDQLTLRHSSPRDIWLHARHAGGAHVVLRWQDPDALPSQRDVIEAATLAALHSAARTSRLVPVDYTRRKYVRKPRRSPPGTVTLERARTVFVEPDPAVEERLRA